MQSTISLKVSPDLVLKLKKASKIRKVTMSDLIRQTLENTFSTNLKSLNKEPEIFKYLGKFDEDDELKEFDKQLEKRKSQYKLRKVDF